MRDLEPELMTVRYAIQRKLEQVLADIPKVPSTDLGVALIVHAVNEVLNELDRSGMREPYDGDAVPTGFTAARARLFGIEVDREVPDHAELYIAGYKPDVVINLGSRDAKLRLVPIAPTWRWLEDAADPDPYRKASIRVIIRNAGIREL